MPLIQYNLFVAVDDGKFLQSSSGGGEYNLPKLKTGDIVPISVQLIRRTGPITSPVYSIIDPSGLALSMGIGEEGGSPAALQTSWTISNQFFTGMLDLTSGALATAVTNNSALFLELKVADATCSQRVYHSPITLTRPVIPNSTTTPVGTAYYLTADEIRAIYLPRVAEAGATWTSTSPTTGLKTVWGTNDDGSVKQDLQQ